MPTAKYHSIYQSLRSAIENGEYPLQQKLPSEHTLIEKYNCSRNTVRRAIRQLAEESYVQSVQGKGVLVIYRKREQARFPFRGIRVMKEAAERNHRSFSTRVIIFEEMTADEDLSRISGFPEGSGVYHVIRTHCLDGKDQIIANSFFLKDVVKGLTSEIAGRSIYEYMEKTLGETIVTTQRKYTVEQQTGIDKQYLDLKDYRCIAQASSQSFNKGGIPFEYTRFRYSPDRLVLYEVEKY